MGEVRRKAQAMTELSTREFMRNLVEEFGGRLTDRQQDTYARKLFKFTGSQLAEIAEHLLETWTKASLPKIGDIYASANELGMLNSVHMPKPHVWFQTDCRLCAGEGRVAVFQRIRYQVGGTLQRQIEFVIPYSGEWPESNPELRQCVARCSCPAGEVETLGKGMPRLEEHP